MKKLLALLFISCAFACATAPRPPVHVVIVGTTDLHGWFAGHDEKVPFGGLPLLASYVDALRAANPNRVLLVDSGDLFQGTLESNYFEGEPIVKAYNELGYAATAVGNHEFDYGPVGPDSVVKTPGEDPLGALKKNAAMAKFPFLAANMTERATGATPAWAKKWIVVNVEGVRIGIIGLATPSTPSTTTASNVATLNFGDPVAATVAAANELRNQGVDAIIVLAHMGGKCSDVKDVHDVASCDVNEEAMQYAEKLPPGIVDAYFAGHTHQQMRTYVNGVPMTQGLAYSREFSTVDLWIDPQHHRVTKTEMRPLTMICAQVFAGTETCDPSKAPAGAALVPRTFEGQTVAPEQRIASILDPYLQKVAAKRNEPVNIRTAARFRRDYNHESPLGDLLADAVRDATGADVGAMNSGGIRANLPQGELLYKDIFQVSPFDNYIAVATLTGAQLQQLLRIQTAGSGGVLQVSGLRYTFDMAKERQNRLVSVTVAPDAKVRIAFPDFLLTAGPAMTALFQNAPHEIRYDLGALRDAIIPVLQKYPQPLAPKTEGRITILNDTTRPSAEDE